MPSKSDDTRYYQWQLAQCRKAGNRPAAHWYLRCLEWSHKRDARRSDRFEPEWEVRSSQPTNYVNG